jgi:hypothetical protein
MHRVVIVGCRIMSTRGSITRGAAASAPGTLAMDALLYRRYLHDGGNAGFAVWETSEGLGSWALGARAEVDW